MQPDMIARVDELLKLTQCCVDAVDAVLLMLVQPTSKKT